MVERNLEEPIDYESGIPLKLQVRNIIRNKVLSKEIVDQDGKIETEHELMKRFNVSRVTIRSALKMLVDEGIIVRERGRGTFLRTNHPENWVGRLMGFSETMAESGLTPGAKILKVGVTSDLDSQVKNSLQVNEAWELKRCRYIGDEPIAIEHAYFPLKYGRYLENQDLVSLAVYKHFEENVGIYLSDAKQIISAVNAGEEEANVLDVEKGKALLSLKRTTYIDPDKPVEFLKAVYRPDYFQYLIKLSRRS